MTETNHANKRWPVCPLMSGAPVPVHSLPPATGIVRPDQVALGSMRVPCAGSECPLWDRRADHCQLGNFASMANALDKISMLNQTLLELKRIFQPPSNSPSPLMRIAESLATIVENQAKGKG